MTFPGPYGDVDQVVEQALEFEQRRLHGAMVLGNGREGESPPVCAGLAHWQEGLSVVKLQS